MIKGENNNRLAPSHLELNLKPTKTWTTIPKHDSARHNQRLQRWILGDVILEIALILSFASPMTNRMTSFAARAVQMVKIQQMKI